MRRAISLGLGAVAMAALLTGCSGSGEADRTRSSLVEAVEGLPDVVEVTGRVSETTRGGLQTHYDAEVTVEMDEGAPTSSYSRIASTAVQATAGGGSGTMIVEDAAGGSFRFTTDAAPETIDATVTAWRDWSGDADKIEPGSAPVQSVRLQLVPIPARDDRPATSSLEALLIYTRPLTPADVASLAGSLQAELPEPLASAVISLGLTDAQSDAESGSGPGSGGTHFSASPLPVPQSVLETIASIDRTTATLVPLGGSVSSIAWYGKDVRGLTDRPEELAITVSFPEDASVAALPLADLQASPQWAAFQEVTTLANPSSVAVGFTLSAGGRRIAGFSTQPCGTADDELDPQRDRGSADTAIRAWWLAPAPACSGVGRHD